MKIFISYSRSIKEKAELIDSLLASGNFRHKIFLDEISLSPSDAWRHKISESIMDSDIYIVLIDKNAIGEGGYFEVEIEEIKEEIRKTSNKKVIPIIFNTDNIDDAPTFFKTFGVKKADSKDNQWPYLITRNLREIKSKNKFNELYNKIFTRKFALFFILIIISLSMVFFLYETYNQWKNSELKREKQESSEEIEDTLKKLCHSLSKKRHFNFINTYSLNKNRDKKEDVILIESYKGSWNELSCDDKKISLEGIEKTYHNIYYNNKGSKILAATAYNSHMGFIDFDSEHFEKTGQYLFIRGFQKPDKYLDFKCNEEYEKKYKENNFLSCSEIEDIYRIDFDAVHGVAIDKGCFSAIENIKDQYYIFNSCRLSDPNKPPYFRIMRSGGSSF